MKKLKLSELGRISEEEFKASQKNPLKVVLDNIRSFHNTGSIFRTADAFRISEVILCGYTPIPPHREIHKTAIGAENSVDWKYEKEIVPVLHKLKNEGWKIYAVEHTNTSLPLQDIQISSDDKIALIFGNEVDGVSNEALSCCDLSLEIPQYGTKHSLNVSVAAGIVIHHLAEKIKFNN